MTALTATIPAHMVRHVNPTGKTIAYDRESRDYMMCLDGNLVGWARTYQEAETILDERAYTNLTHAIAGLDVPAATEAA